MDGFRRSLVKEFDDIYAFDLRGNQRTQGEESRREGGKVFGSGSRTPVSITLLVKHAGETHAGRIHYHDVGDYLTREEKLDIVREAAVRGNLEWTEIVPDKHGDWLDQRDDSVWSSFAPMGVTKHGGFLGLFEIWSCGPKTQRDAWVYNSNKDLLIENMRLTTSFFNTEVERYISSNSKDVEKFVNKDMHHIKWDKGLYSAVREGAKKPFCSDCARVAAYRPFFKQWFFDDRQWSWSYYKIKELVPDGALPNILISITGGNNPSALITDCMPDFHYVGDSQCFPLYWYEEKEVGSALFDSNDYVSSGAQTSLFGNGATRTERTYVRHDAITDEALTVFREAYPHAFLGRYKKDGGDELSKEDIFYYVYGVLHSPEYRSRFASNLQKELPRIPLAADFAAFSRAGRALAELHLNYETVEPWGSIEEVGDPANPGRTVKMRFGKRKKTDDNPKGVDRTTLHVSEGLTLRGIPEEAYGYVVNGRSAVEWLMDRYQVRTDKASGIVNDPNEYSDDPRYIIELVERVVTVSMQTLEIVAQLPPLREMPQPENWPSAWSM